MSSCEVISSVTGFSFEKCGSEWKCKEHDSLRVFKDGKGWTWYSQNISGANCIDFLMKSRRLLTAAGNNVANTRKVYAERLCFRNDEQPQKPKEIKLPERTEGKYSRVYAYLMKKRCIDLEVINYCVKNELLYEDKRGNCVFVGKNDNGQPKYAMLRGTYTPKMDSHTRAKQAAQTKCTVFAWTAPAKHISLYLKLL